jgi:hypothetical protein
MESVAGPMPKKKQPSEIAIDRPDFSRAPFEIENNCGKNFKKK